MVYACLIPQQFIHVIFSGHRHSNIHYRPTTSARLLMDQLVPASYLQLEDTVRKIAHQYHINQKPPVLSAQEFRYVVYFVMNGFCGMMEYILQLVPMLVFTLLNSFPYWNCSIGCRCIDLCFIFKFENVLCIYVLFVITSKRKNQEF